MKSLLRRWGQKMNKNDLYGSKSVFEFTLIQTLKSKYYKIFTIILCALVLISVPVVEVITNGLSDVAKTSDIKKVYIIDETGISKTDYSGISEEYEEYKDIIFDYTSKSEEEIKEEIKNNNDGSIFLRLSQGDMTYNMDFLRTPDGNVSEMQVQNLGNAMIEVFKANLIKNLDISTEQMAKLEEPILTEVETYTGVIDDESTGFHITESQYNMVFALLFVAIMVVSYSGQGVASSVVTEKSSKLVEILLTKVRPMAIVVGKVLAMLTVVLTQMIMVIISFILSSIIYKVIFNSENFLPSIIYDSLGTDIFQNITFVNILLCLIIFILGFIFYAFLGGLVGATISKLEELNEGMISYSFTMIVGAYIGLGILFASGIGGVSYSYLNFACIFPLSSLFISPSFILLGEISVGIALLAIVALLVSIFLLVIFTSKVYQTLILTKGNRIKIKDLIAISKMRKEAR